MNLPAHLLLSPLAEPVYQAAVALGTATPEAIGQQAGVDAAKTLAEITALEALGLVEVAGAQVTAVAPRLPLERLALEHARAVDAARVAAAAFADIWTQATNRQSFVEIITDEARCNEIERHLMDDAVSTVDGLCIGPVSPRRLPPGMEIPQVEVAAGFFEAMRRGVAIRGLYGVSVLEDSIGLAAVQECMAAGEESRVLPNVPLNLTIFDAKRAYTSVPGHGGARRALIVIHESGFLDSLIGIFEVFWQMGVPLSSDSRVIDEGGVKEGERQLLAYLAAGLTDEAIARDLGISPRTLGRRIARLEQVLGAHSRFQLAVQASRRGWL